MSFYHLAGMTDESDDSEDDFNSVDVIKFFSKDSNVDEKNIKNKAPALPQNNKELIDNIDNQYPVETDDDQIKEQLIEDIDSHRDLSDNLDSYSQEKTVPVEENGKSGDDDDEQELEFQVLSACMSGNVDIIDEYVNSGKDVNKYLHTGWTLLLYAASAASPEAVELLLKLGADPNKHHDGFTPLMAVCNSKGTEEQVIKCIDLLVNAKANLDASSKDRRTPLMYACQTHGAGVVSELLKYVKNINAADKDGRSAIFDAVIANNTEALQILLEHNASTSIVDRRNLTIKDIADEKHFKKISNMLDSENDSNHFCRIVYPNVWKDSITIINHIDSDSIDSEIENILYALSLDSYKTIFTGMNLKTFLQLTDVDLIQLGMDIQYHRKKFLNGLLKFHSSKWKPQSLKKIDKTMPFSIYDGFVCLASFSRQFGIIGSSFSFVIKTFLNDSSNKMIKFEDSQKEMFKKEIEETEKLVIALNKDIQKVLKLSNKIRLSNSVNPPPAYIEPVKSNNTTKWTIILTVSIVTGFVLYKVIPGKTLWN